MIDALTVQRIKDAARIEDVVGDFVVLKRAGSSFKGLCPFHEDHSPSFHVSPAKNFCWCFACGQGGNPISFVMKHEDMSYVDALRYLAKKYNIEIHERDLSPEEIQRSNERESLFALNSWALEWFKAQLHDTPDGKAIGQAYFRSRGFRDDIIEKFQLGFCPNGLDSPMSTAALSAGYKSEYLVATGLSLARDNGQLRDRFYGRVIFPFINASGRVVGFGGRVLDAATKGVAVKYLNSPASAVYDKSREVYGIYQARSAIQNKDNCFLVEGYTDVLSMHQSGVENVVASSGTALTNEQIRLIKRYTSNITVIYDGDAAGIKASQRGIDMLLAQGMNVKLLLLPDNEDPDSFARKHSAQELQDYLQGHKVDFIQFKTKLLKDEAQGDPQAMARFVKEIVNSIACIPDPITRNFYVQETASSLRLDESLISKAVQAGVAQRLKEQQIERERKQRATVLEGLQGTDVPPTGQGGANNLPDDDFAPPAIGEDGMPVTETYQAPPAEDVFVQQIKQHKTDIFEKKEAELLKAVVRYGERVAGSYIDDNGQEQALTVIEFFYYALQTDDLELRTPKYQQMLSMAMEHLHDEGFVSEKFFLEQDDQQLSADAFLLASDREELSSLYGKTVEKSEEELGSLVQHLMADYKLELVKEEEHQLSQQLQNGSSLSQSELQSLMQRRMELLNLKRELAKIGDRVIG